MGPAADLLPKHGGSLYCGFLSHHDWPHRDHHDLNVIGQPHPRGSSLKTRDPPTVGMDLERKKDRKRIMMPVPDVAHRNIKSKK